MSVSTASIATVPLSSAPVSGQRTAAAPRVVHPGDALRPRRRFAYVVILGLLVALGPFTTDLYLPAFPAVQAAFGVSDVAIQLTLSGTVLGFAIGQLVVGPWSDRIGRRIPLLVTTSLHVATCLLAAFAPDVTTLSVLRLLQGVGAAGGGVVAAAIVRDLFGGHQLVKMLARMGLVSGVAPVLAPVIGSQLLHVLDWRGLFVSLAVYGAAALVLASIGIRETRAGGSAAVAAPRSVRSRYSAVLRDRVFIGTAVVGGTQFAGVFAYLSVSPFLLQQVYGMTPQQYGFTFAANSVGLILGAQISSRLMRRFGPQWVLVGTVAAQLVAGVVLLTTAGSGAPLIGVLIPLFVFMTAFGFAFPAVQVLGLIHHGEEAGTAASLLGAANFGLAAVVSPVMGLLGSLTGVSIGIVITIASTLAVASLIALVRPRSVPAIH